MSKTISIDVPKVRPLNNNEKRVYELLKQGCGIAEISERTGIKNGSRFMGNDYDSRGDTVQYTISSIRSKGYNDFPDVKR